MHYNLALQCNKLSTRVSKQRACKYSSMLSIQQLIIYWKVCIAFVSKINRYTFSKKIFLNSVFNFVKSFEFNYLCVVVFSLVKYTLSGKRGNFKKYIFLKIQPHVTANIICNVYYQNKKRFSFKFFLGNLRNYLTP